MTEEGGTDEDVVVNQAYSRGVLENRFRGLGRREAVFIRRQQNGSRQIVLVLLRDNSAGYINSFQGRLLTMEGRQSARDKNESLRGSGDDDVQLFWSESGGTYTYLGPVRLERHLPGSDGIGPTFTFRLLDDRAVAPTF
jgi:hypothetical protein